MNTELDRTYDPFESQSNEEFEQFLDDLYSAADAEYAEREMGKLEMMGRDCDSDS